MDGIQRLYGNATRQGAFLPLLLGLVLCAGCGEKYRASLTDDEARKFVAKQKPVPPPALAVSGETITVDMVYNSPKDLAGRQILLGPYLTGMARGSDWDEFRDSASKDVRTSLESMIYNTLLYQQAKREGGTKMKDGLEKAADRIWREFMVEHGGDAASAEDALRKMGIDRKEFKERRKREILTHYLISLRFPSDRPIGHKELAEYYNRMKAEQFVIKPRLTFRLIDIQPSKLKLTDPTVDRSEQARQVAEDLTAKLAAGEDFSQLARQYSHDPMASSGGLWNSVDPQSLAEPYDAVAAKASELPIGQVDGPLDIKGHQFIVRLEARQEQGYQPLEKVQYKIENQIRRDRYRQAQEKLEAELAERAKVGKTEEFVNGCVAELYRRSRVSA